MQSVKGIASIFENKTSGGQTSSKTIPLKEVKTPSKSIVSSLIDFFAGRGKNDGSKTSEGKPLTHSSEEHKNKEVLPHTTSTGRSLWSVKENEAEATLHVKSEKEQRCDLSSSSASPLRKNDNASRQNASSIRSTDNSCNKSKNDKAYCRKVENNCSNGSTRNIAHLVGFTDLSSEHVKAEKEEHSNERGNIMTGNGIPVILDNKTPLRIGEKDNLSNIPKWSLLQSEEELDSHNGSETICKKKTYYDNMSRALKEDNHQNYQGVATEFSNKSTGTEKTSGIYSGSSPKLSNGDDRMPASTEDMQQRQNRRTARYVEEVNSLQHSSRHKYPSEPSNLQHHNKTCGVRTRTQENVCRISDSRFTIHSSDESGYAESVSVSQISLVTSDQQEIRESIAEQTKQILSSHVPASGVSRHRRLKEARRVLERERVVFLVSENGSGATHLGWDLLSLETSTEKYNLLEVDHFQICNRSKESVSFLIDDGFGTSKLDESALDKWLKYVNNCKRNRSRNARFIFTVKRHIKSQCESRLSDFETCIVDLESQRLQLDSEEMLDIMSNMAENNTKKWKLSVEEDSVPSEKNKKSKKSAHLSKKLLSDISENASPLGFPKMFKNFLENRTNLKQGLNYFTRPTSKDMNDINDMKKSNTRPDLDKNLTLVITAVCGGKLKMDRIHEIEHTRQVCFGVQPTKAKKKSRRKSKGQKERAERAVEIPWWIEMINHYAQNCGDSLHESVRAGVNLLKGRYIREDIKGVFGFASPRVKNTVLISLCHDFPQYVMKICDMEFFKDYVGVESRFVSDENRCVKIDVLNKSICSEANEKLMELHDTGDIESFAKHKLFQDAQFLQQFIDLFGKNIDSLWKVIKGNNEKSVISFSLENNPMSPYAVVGNWAYLVLRHKVWSQKRKSYPEWTSHMELEVIKHCCEHGHVEIYFELKKKYKIAVNYDCLLLAIKGGTRALVDDILEAIDKSLSSEEKCKCMELALLKYTRNPLNSRHDVVNALLKVVSVDYKIKGMDPIIHTATKTNDSRVIVTIEVFDGDINVTNSDGKTCLHEAIKRNKAAFLTMALKHGADQRKADKHGILPIHEGAIQNKPNIMKKLMEADDKVVKASDKLGRQPLHYAAIHNNVEAAKCLTEYGAEVDAYDDEQKTPLHYAAESGKGTVVHCLLEANADETKQDKDGYSPLELACKNRNVKGVKRLLRSESPMKLDSWQNKCLFIAVEENQASILKMLADKGLDVNQRNNKGKTLLHFAIEVNPNIVETLIAEKVDVNFPCDGMFPVHVAASKGEKRVFQLLTDAGANISEVTQDSRDTALHIAINNGHDELTYHILQKDESLMGCRNTKGEVPLHVAARQGNITVTRALLSRGAERSPINKRFQTPLDLVKEKLLDLESQTHREEYENYYSVMMLLTGHRVMLETAL